MKIPPSSLPAALRLKSLKVSSLEVTESLRTPKPWHALVTDLPSNGEDGDEVYFLADATNGIVWHLRYRAQSPSSYKWEFVGGPPAALGPQGTQSAYASTTPTEITGGPRVTVPRNGEYIIDYGGFASNAGTYAGAYTAYQAATGSVTGQLAGNPVRVSIGNAWEGAEVGRSLRRTLTNAGEFIWMAVWNDRSGSSTTFADAWIKLTPIRIS